MGDKPLHGTTVIGSVSSPRSMRLARSSASSRNLGAAQVAEGVMPFAGLLASFDPLPASPCRRTGTLDRIGLFGGTRISLSRAGGLQNDAGLQTSCPQSKRSTKRVCGRLFRRAIVFFFFFFFFARDFLRNASNIDESGRKRFHNGSVGFKVVATTREAALESGLRTNLC